MAYGGAIAATVAVSQHTSSYRVKFRRKQFLDLVAMARPKIIYHVRRMHFFAYDGFVMYTFECKNEDFSQKIMHGVEFSNWQWSE